MTWIAELSKPDNSALRQSGNVDALISKYKEPAGDAVWRSAPMGEVLWFANVTAINWDPAVWTTLRSEHVTAGGFVKLDEAATRTFAQGIVTADEWIAIAAAFSSRPTLAATLGLSAPTNKTLIPALGTIADTPQFDHVKRHDLMRAIRSKLNSADLTRTSSANLTIIETALGVY